MSYLLLKSSSFEKAAKKLIKKKPEYKQNIRECLVQLSSDPFHNSLKLHKLKGKLNDSWSCYAGYDLRLILKFVEYKIEDSDEVQKAILLETIGTHDEVY